MSSAATPAVAERCSKLDVEALGLSSSLRASPLGRFHQILHKRRNAQFIRSRGCKTFEGCILEGRFGDLFPARLPERPEGLFCPHPGISRRRSQRLRVRREAWRLGEWIWSAFSFYGSGSPKSGRAVDVRLGPWLGSSRHSVCFQMLVDDLLPFCRLDPALAAGKGRGIARLVQLETLLETIVPEHVVSSSLESQVVSALPVDVEEVSKRMPVQCGLCDPPRLVGR